jgi:hypothetical protein
MACEDEEEEDEEDEDDDAECKEMIPDSGKAILRGFLPPNPGDVRSIVSVSNCARMQKRTKN